MHTTNATFPQFDIRPGLHHVIPVAPSSRLNRFQVSILRGRDQATLVGFEDDPLPPEIARGPGVFPSKIIRLAVRRADFLVVWSGQGLVENWQRLYALLASGHSLAVALTRVEKSEDWWATFERFARPHAGRIHIAPTGTFGRA